MPNSVLETPGDVECRQESRAHRAIRPRLDASMDTVEEHPASLVVELAVPGSRAQKGNVLVRGIVHAPEVASGRDVAKVATRRDLRAEIPDCIRVQRRLLLKARADRIVVLLHLRPERIGVVR